MGIIKSFLDTLFLNCWVELWERQKKQSLTAGRKLTVPLLLWIAKQFSGWGFQLGKQLFGSKGKFTSWHLPTKWQLSSLSHSQQGRHLLCCSDYFLSVTFYVLQNFSRMRNKMASQTNSCNNPSSRVWSGSLQMRSHTAVVRDTKHHIQPTGKQKVKGKKGKKQEPKTRTKGKDTQAGSKIQKTVQTAALYSHGFTEAEYLTSFPPLMFFNFHYCQLCKE